MIAPRFDAACEPAPATRRAGLLNVEQVAELLGVCTKTVRRMMKAAKLPRHIELGRLFKWKADEIHRWIEAGCPDREEWEAREKWNPLDALHGLRSDKNA